MKVIGYLREKSKLPSPEGETASGFYVPLDTVNPELRKLSGREDARVVRGELNETRTEVTYLTQWGRVVVPVVAFVWILEQPERKK